MPLKLVTIRTFDMPLDAHAARNCLLAEGIKAVLLDEATVGNVWSLGTALGGIKLQVAAADVSAANEILKSVAPPVKHRHDEDEDAVDDRDDAPDDEPNPYEDDDGNDDWDDPPNAREQTAERAAKAAILGLFLCPLEFYALYLLLLIGTSDEPLRPKYRLRVIAATVVCLPGLILLTMVLKSFTRG